MEKQLNTVSFELFFGKKGIQTVSVSYIEANFSLLPEIIKMGAASDEDVKFLVFYDKTSGTVTVDERAPREYKELSALHAVALHNHDYEDWAWSGSFEDEEDISSAIESTIYETQSIMFKYDLSRYYLYRQLMYEFMLMNDMNSEDAESLEKNLETVKSLLECVIMSRSI